MINKLFLIGRLTKDPEVVQIPSGATRTQFTLAVERPYNGENNVDFIPVVCWDKVAENVGKYCQKGRMVHVEGHVQTRSYEDATGERKFILGIVGDRISFLDRPKNTSESPIVNDSFKEFKIAEDDIQF